MLNARLVGTLSIAALVAALVVPASAAPAHAATPSQILVSTDGVTFLPTMSDAVFNGVGLLVPQDVVTVSFWVRNPTISPAQMRVSVSHLTSSSTQMSANMRLTSVDVGTGASESAVLADLTSCKIIVPPRAIAGGETMRVDLTLEMMDVPGQVAQSKIGKMDFLVGMRDAAAGAFPSSACDDVGVAIPAIPPTAPAGDPGGLIKTGVDLPYDMFALAAGLLGFGFLLLVRRRRERREES